MLALAAVAIVVGSLAAYLAARPFDLDAAPPQVLADLPELIEGPLVSTVDAPVTYDLASAVDSLEASVPRSYGDIDAKRPVTGMPRASYSFRVTRSPFRVRVIGRSLSISADIEYAGRVWYRPIIGPELSASCGTGREVRPRAHITLVADTWLTPEWRLGTRTRVQRLEPYSSEGRDHCRLTVLRFDVTERVFEATRHMLEERLARFDRSAARWPVRPRFERLWLQIQRPIRLAPRVFLVLDPSSAQLGSVGAEGPNVVAHLRLVASPRIVTGERPSGPEYTRPLPPLQLADSVGRVTTVKVNASISYPVASELLQGLLAGREFAEGGRRVHIQRVRVTGIGGGRIALEVRLAGAARGALYFTGTPRFDPRTRQVYVPDLDYDFGTSQVLVSGFGWLRGVDIRAFLRARARLPGNAVMARLGGLAESGVNRILAPGVVLSGRIYDAEGTSVRATLRSIQLRATAKADLRLDVDKPPPLGRLKRRR